MVERAPVHDLRRLRKRAPLPIPADACHVLLAFDRRGPDTTGRVRFHLRRSARGTEISFSVAMGPRQSFTWNVSAMLDVWPPTFEEARTWVQAYAARHGQTVDEIVKARTKRPTGGDRKALRAGRCHESWLSSDVPTLWAEAMVRCQHAAGHCGQDGYCHLGNCDMVMDVPMPSDDEATRP